MNRIAMETFSYFDTRSDPSREEKIGEPGYTFTFSFVYALTKYANEIEEFRCRFWEGKTVVYDRVNTSFTYLDKESELFKIVNVEMQDTMEEYVCRGFGKTN